MTYKMVFLSSTAEDLTEYREAAYRAIEGLDGYHCVRMEDFGARDAMADELCRSKVAECDLFVGIVGHCYGSIPEGSEKSYTEQEYDAAVDTGKPRLMFIAHDDFPLPPNSLREPDAKWQKQRAFRDRVSAERIRDTFTSPDDLARRVVQATHNWERGTAGIVRELIKKGRVRVVNEDLFQRPASVEEINDYYEGRARLTWNVVAAQGIIERDQQAKLFEQLITPSGQTQMMCIVGEPGAGKSSLAWQLARELTRQQGNSILQILDNTDDDIWYHLFDFSAQPFYVLVDDIFRDDGVVRALKALDRDLPLTILATSRTNEYRGHERLPFPVERVDLPEPSPVEKGHILRKLGKEWTQLTTEQRARLEAANQFLVLMMELATGKELTDIIRDTLNMLQQQDEVVYRAYEYLCYTYQYDISMPSSLLERLDDKGRFYCLLDKKASRGLIFADEQRTGHLQVGHSLIAERSARLYGRDPCSVFGEILGAVDTNDWVERRYAAYLLLEMARSVSETCLPDLLERNTGMIEDIQREATINEMAIWRALYKGLGRQKEADRCVDMALGKEPVSSIDCTTLLGVCRERRQEAKALPLFQQWLEHTPDDHHARVAYLRLVEHHAPEQVAELIEETSLWLADHPQNTNIRQSYLGLVDRKGMDKQVADAIDETSTWLAGHPQNTNVRAKYLGLVERKGTTKQVARVVAETIVCLSQDTNVRTKYLGFVERKGTTKQVAQVVAETSVWLSRHPQDREVRGKYLSFVHHKGKTEQKEIAVQQIRQWLTDHPEKAGFQELYGYGRLLLDLEEFREAAKQFRALLRTHREHAIAHKNLALALNGLEGFDEAEQEFKQAIKWAEIKHQPLGIFYHDLGLFYVERECYLAAQSALETAIQESPERFANYWHLGRALMGECKYREAASAFQTALDKAPEDLGPPASEEIVALLEECQKQLET